MNPSLLHQPSFLLENNDVLMDQGVHYMIEVDVMNKGGEEYWNADLETD